MDINYYYLIFFKEDLLKNQLIEEVLREKAEFYISRKKSLDFWILNSPLFLNKEEYLNRIKNSNYYKDNKKKYNTNTYSIIISSNKELITWLKLRIGYFENLSEVSDDKIKLSSDGLYGLIKAKNFSNLINPLKSLVNKYNFLNYENNSIY